MQSSFFHNGAFTRLSEALRFHLNAIEEARHYNAGRAGVATDLTMNTGPISPVLQRLDPALSRPIALSDQEFANLLAFLRDGLLDDRARPGNLGQIIPSSVPSGLSLHVFQTTPAGP